MQPQHPHHGKGTMSSRGVPTGVMYSEDLVHLQGSYEGLGGILKVWQM